MSDDDVVHTVCLVHSCVHGDLQSDEDQGSQTKH